ncbi:MAG: cytochrome c oxidase assembly protein, partial [Acidiferrobacterales bacterium]
MNSTFVFDFFLPWNFSPTVLGVVLVAAMLYMRGARDAVSPAPARRRFAFYLGLALIYAALQTKWDYYAGHMFFVHRLQHFVLQDVGPFLLAFSAPGSALARGVPSPVR